MCKCNFPGGVTIKLDSVHELDPCQYKPIEIHRNVTVEVLRCKVCGRVELGWYRQDDTESEVLEDGKE